MFPYYLKRFLSKTIHDVLLSLLTVFVYVSLIPCVHRLLDPIRHLKKHIIVLASVVSVIALVPFGRFRVLISLDPKMVGFVRLRCLISSFAGMSLPSQRHKLCNFLGIVLFDLR